MFSAAINFHAPCGSLARVGVVVHVSRAFSRSSSACRRGVTAVRRQVLHGLVSFVRSLLPAPLPRRSASGIAIPVASAAFLVGAERSSNRRDEVYDLHSGSHTPPLTW